MKWKRNLRFGVLIAVLGSLMFVALHQSGGPAKDGAAPNPTEPAPTAKGAVKPAKLREVAKRIPAPDFTLASTDGEKFTLSAAKGKGPVIVNFFSTT
jgi:cytochrome oxidase Cu insertion factor (SCO1/SenC/PrrC family)